MRRWWKGANGGEHEHSDMHLSAWGFVHHMVWPGKEPRPPR